MFLFLFSEILLFTIYLSRDAYFRPRGQFKSGPPAPEEQQAAPEQAHCRQRRRAHGHLVLTLRFSRDFMYIQHVQKIVIPLVAFSFPFPLNFNGSVQYYA